MGGGDAPTGVTAEGRGVPRMPQAPTVRMAAETAAVHHAPLQPAVAGIANTIRPDSAIPTPTPPIPHPGRCGEWSRRCSSNELTATTNTTALANPATVRSVSQPNMLDANGINARVAIRTTSEVRHAVVDRANRCDRVAATAPPR